MFIFRRFTNCINALRLVYANLHDDPSYFLLQISRRFKDSRPAKLAIRLFISNRKGISATAIAAFVKDDRKTLTDACADWLHGSPNNAKMAQRLSSLCIASGEWDVARTILNGKFSSPGIVRNRARLEWALGNLSEAIRILESLGTTRQLKHYKSELSVFEGFTPVLTMRADSILEEAHVKRVLFLATNSLPFTGSGYAQRTHSMMGAVAKRGWEVLVTTRVNYPMNIGYVFAAPSSLVEQVNYKHLMPFPAKYEMTAQLQQQAHLLQRLAHEVRPSILHTTTDFKNGVAVNAVSKVTGIPWVYEVRGQLADTWLSQRPESCRKSERYRLFMQREVEVAKSADYVVTLGENMRTNLIDSGVDARKILVSPNGIGDEYVQEPIEKGIARASLKLEKHAFYVGTVSSLVPYEGLDTLLRAVQLLAPNNPSLRVLIVGDGTERENLIRLASDLGISNICDFPGRVPRNQAHLYHSSLNVFVVPRIDSDVTRSVTPLKPVEALASAVPVVASALPALMELITDGENGLLVHASDPVGLSEALKELILNPQKVSLMGKSGRKFVLNNRTWTQNAVALTEVYDHVIAKCS